MNTQHRVTQNLVGIIRRAFLSIAVLGYTAVALAEGGPNTSISGAYVLWPDGMAVSDSIPASTGQGTEGTPQWFRFGAGARRSYSIEIFQLRENGINSPAQATLGAAFSDTNAATAVPFSDHSFADPSGGDFNPLALRRFSIKDLESNGRVFLKIVSALNYETSATQSFKIRVFDTTLVGVKALTVRTDTFVVLHNSSNQPAQISIHFYDQEGTLVGTTPLSLNARGSTEYRFAAKDAIYGGKQGSIEVTHDLSPGSLTGHIYISKVVTKTSGAADGKAAGKPAIQQFPLQESRSWGRGAF